ncbi:methyltransferase type 12 [Rhodopirellula maiorica SM1]|uniref:Methyltransferase type 12 n=1 Tax=Rhodopirellula maiorica SM1 TaxID=1265738 RepID=M5RWC7_9BACT|nr:class I SAM-dependent methyltransferase [Rhodopirellula maiorica]EMI19702.1 methyltransferase type 12 [Rhodopirellula maiorica SM1]
MKFIQGCGSEWMQRAPKRLFEPACGTGRLLYALVKKGFRVDGLDLNPKAVEFCNARFRRHGVRESAFVADMSDFKTKWKCDLAFNTINSFRHLCSEREARGHLQCMGEVVRPGGLYLLGVHLTPTAVAPSETESWSARRGHLAISTHMWTNERNTESRIERFGIRFDIHSPSHSFRITDELALRSYTPKQMNRLIQSSKCWEVAATYDFGYDLQHPIEVDASTEDVVYVLRRKPE